MEKENELFENKTPYNYEEIKAFYQFHMYQKRKLLFILLLICIIVIILASIGMLVLKNYLIGSIYLVLGILAAIWLKFAPCIMANRICKKYKSKDKIFLHYIFMEDAFQLESNIKNARVDYTQIIFAFETDENYYLYMNHHLAYIVSKAGFVSSYQYQFKQMLEKKLKSAFVSKDKKKEKKTR